MADEQVHTNGPEAPPPGEAIHLPGPSYLPVITAAGVTFAIVGIVLSWILVVLGGAVAVYAIWRWVRDTRRDISELPLQHH